MAIQISEVVEWWQDRAEVDLLGRKYGVHVLQDTTLGSEQGEVVAGMYCVQNEK